MKTKKIIKFVLIACFVITSVVAIQRLLMPKYMDNVVEGALIAEYYDEDIKEHDVIFIGDCEVYENFSPITLWEEYGITSFIRGSAQQLIWQSYYLLEETLKYETPKVVVFNVLSMKYDTPQNEAYNRMTLDGMKWSSSKYNSIKASMTKDEKMLDYIFPILRYHSRWSELSSEDIKYFFSTDKISHNGYYMRVDTKPVPSFPVGKVLADYQFGDNSYKYLDKIVKLCKDNDIELILIKAPSVYPYWYPEWETQMEEYAKNNSLRYINYLDIIEEVAIDYNTDTYDAGLHMNLSGAEKCTRYLGNILSNEIKLPNRQSESKLSKIWAEKTAFYYEMKELQLKELEEYGEIKSLGGRR